MNRTFSISVDNFTKYGELSGTLLQSSVIAHILHFQNNKNSFWHEALQKYYEGIIDPVDELTEMILSELTDDLNYVNKIDMSTDPIVYMDNLYAFCNQMKSDLFGEDDGAFQSVMDEILALIKSTKFKLIRYDLRK